MHICVSKLTIIVPDNGLSPDWRQAIIWTNAGILLIPTSGTNLHAYIFIQENALEYIICETAAILSRPQCVKGKRSNILTSFQCKDHLTRLRDSHDKDGCSWEHLIILSMGSINVNTLELHLSCINTSSWEFITHTDTETDLRFSFSRNDHGTVWVNS